MAAADSLTSWALANARRLGLEVTQVTWPEEWLPGFFDYRVSISIGDSRYIGQGMDRKEPLAFTKAVAEALERASLSGQVKLWATAAHIDLERASRNAYLELLGIDRALCHHFCGSPLRPIALESFIDRPTLNVLSRMLRKNSLSLHAFEMRPVLDARSCVVFCWGDDVRGRVPGFVAGFGSGSATETSALHALLECLRSATSIFAGATSPSPEKPLEELARRESPRWHYWMSKTAESRGYVQSTLIQNPMDEAGSWEPEEISILDVRFRRITELEALLPDLPLVIVHAQSDRLMRPQFGRHPMDSPSLNRLECFSGRPLQAITSLPHFYG